VEAAPGEMGPPTPPSIGMGVTGMRPGMRCWRDPARGAIRTPGEAKAVTVAMVGGVIRAPGACPWAIAMPCPTGVTATGCGARCLPEGLDPAPVTARAVTGVVPDEGGACCPFRPLRFRPAQQATRVVHSEARS
jgi:hypothetical protein